ncbi:hypothetical protein CROQUDRAFT_669213 [Cronartium quercuum f. sp. fusiforme G11]|uniref:PWI domain-containing protein n=1 Tax=Cronartium quercuum f. sp. fusiforme G11 TaxID=708437 RepID=A0A9P6NSI6_9BASI|nr:hypothetical protein CROQUDRAFT_669213 [Cronartium quercuum f. sp. fusiforme G11]
MYGNAYPPYPPHGQQPPPLSYGPPPGQFPLPPGSAPFVMNSSQQPNPMPFGPPSTSAPNNPAQPPPTPMGYGPPPTHNPAAQQQPPSSQPVASPGQLPPPGVPNSFHHLPPPPGFPHLHPQHLPPPGLHQPVLHPSHPPFPHHPPPNFIPPGRHVGLGAHGQPHNINSIISPPLNLNSPINSQPSPTPALPPRPAPTEIYSLFVGSIAEGVDDAWLERLLSVAGHLVSLRRIRDPNGKPKPFGFAEYGDPESVLRCLKVIDGAKLPIEGGRAGEKALMIKPDDKTKARLNAYEATRIRTDQDAELDTQAVERLEGLISQMKDPDVLAATASEPTSSSTNGGPPSNGAANGNNKKNNAAHLQDLAPEDLPEESRGLITREIQFFRERAISKRGDAEKSKEQRDRTTGSGSPGPRGFSSSNPKGGYGSSNNTPMGPRGSGSAAGASGSPDPQTFNRQMGFVRAGQMAAAAQQQNDGGSAVLSDEAEEKAREDRRKRMNHLEFKDRERRWETRERNRAQTIQRENQREKSIREEESRLRNQMRVRLANWDDDVELVRGKELFYSNRSKWRMIRQTFRQREEKSDRIDEELEQEQLEAIKKESEEFLNKQAEMIAKIQDENRKAGLLQLDEGGKPIQLSFGGFSANPSGPGQINGKTNASMTMQPISLKKDNKAGGGVLGSHEDDEDGFRRKRALIPLTYDDDEKEKEKNASNKINIQFGKTESTKPKESAEDKKKKKMRELVSSIPNDKDALWQLTVDWKWLSEVIITEKLVPFANKKIIEYLGMQEDELVSAIIDHLRAHKDAQGLVTELEPVLAEEAEEFTFKIWRVLIFELRAAEAGLIST